MPPRDPQTETPNTRRGAARGERGRGLTAAPDEAGVGTAAKPSTRPTPGGDATRNPQDEHGPDFRLLLASVVTPKAGSDERVEPTDPMDPAHPDISAAERQLARMRDSMQADGLDPDDDIDQAYHAARRGEPTEAGLGADDDVPASPAAGRMGGYYTDHVRAAKGMDLAGLWGAPAAAPSIPRFILDPVQKVAARLELAGAIDDTARHYAKKIGMNPADLAKVMDGIAVIESAYGTKLSVSGTKHVSSAGGAFHFLDSHARHMVDKHGHDPRVAGLLREAGIVTADGVTRGEAWDIKLNNHVAASMVALEIAQAIKGNPALRNDPQALISHVYRNHNMGHAGHKALLEGGIARLNQVDYRIDDNNPMFFRGARSTNDVVLRYDDYTRKAIEAAEKFRLKMNRPAGGDHAPATTVASLKMPTPEPTFH